MRLLLVLVLLINVGLFTWGRGVFHPPPAEAGRNAAVPDSKNPEIVKLGQAHTTLHKL